MSIISALCEEGQIDINTASAEKLDEIIHVGPKVAEYIIKARPFSSIDDLINVSYISSGYLEEIIDQGLACVNEETEEIEEEKEKIEDKEIIEDEEKQEPEPIYDSRVDENENKIEKIEPEIIKLNAKTIKREDNNENPDKNNYAVYGFVVFCVLLGFLFILKKRKNYKTEFEEHEE